MGKRKNGTDSTMATGEVPIPPSGSLPFFVVAIGASAGGVEAIGHLLEHLPPDTGAAFIVVLHLDPDQESRLAEVLAHRTPMPVVQITDRMQIEPDRVHVIAPNASLAVEGIRLRLTHPTLPPALRRPVDELFQSLAAAAGSRAVAVVMSGTGTNGSAGLAGIKAGDGVIFAQEPSTAAFDGMAKSAMETGLVDQVLEPEALAAAIADYVAARPVAADDAQSIEQAQFKELLELLRGHSHIDLQNYRRPTLARRINRRMSLRGLRQPAEYLELLRRDPGERDSLANDMMISVTGFFRDPEAWETLREKVIAPLAQSREDGDEIRCWATACSTGEEAYTLAILLTEGLEAAATRNVDVKIFATDLSAAAIARARAGSYADGISIQMAPERLQRFFDRQGDRYRIKKAIREKVTFAPHNLLADPPFSRLDIATCRNVLIYLEPTVQRRVLRMLHFALKPKGVLMLGSSESTRRDGGFFEPIDAKHRIYRRVGHARHDFSTFPLGRSAARDLPLHGTGAARSAEHDVASIARQALANLTTAAALLDARRRVLYFHGDTDRYLTNPRGKADLDIYGMARPGLEVPIRTAISRARSAGGTASAEAAIAHRGERIRVRVTATPLDGDDLLLLSFRQQAPADVPHADVAAKQRIAVADDRGSNALREELRQSHLELAHTVADLEKSNEGLIASNEEVLSINEELQSTNEELETSKEELQSLNEELATVNTQLQSKVEELERTSNNLANLLKSSDIATLFLSRDMKVKWFTPAVGRLFNLIDSDVGRPITDLAQKLVDGDITQDCREVLKTLVPLRTECRDTDGRWYLRRTTPYRTSDDSIEGVVVTFVDISHTKEAEQEAQRAAMAAHEATAAKDEFLARLSHELRTPLQPALLGVSGFAGRDDLPRDVSETLEAVRRNIEIEIRLIDDLLDLTRAGYGRLHLRREHVDVLDLLNDSVRLCRDLSAAKHQSVSVEGTAGECCVSGDRVRLRQVVWNLLRNAARFTGDHGRIALRCERHGNRVLIEIEDDGVGISADRLPHIFDTFERSKESVSGLGLGLSIARSLVEAHDGWIEAVSEGPGRGSTFRVWLPAAASPPPETAAGQPATAGEDPDFSLAGLYILLIEDHADSARVLASLLRAAGTRTRTATTLQQALQAVRDDHFDVIISDLSLPDGDAYGLVDAVPPETPVIALSGFGAPEDIEHSMGAGFAEHLVKPVTLAELRAAIGRVQAGVSRRS